MQERFDVAAAKDAGLLADWPAVPKLGIGGPAGTHAVPARSRLPDVLIPRLGLAGGMMR